jgi:hypothetical protein
LNHWRRGTEATLERLAEVGSREAKGQACDTTVRADGRKIHPMYLLEVKKLTESKGPWDYFKVRATIPADEAFRPLSEGGCPLVNR